MNKDNKAVSCSSNNCDDDATQRVFWPGKEPLPMCYKHVQGAINVSNAMGFYLHVEQLKQGEQG